MLKPPWYYLTWKPETMPAEYEMALARLTRRRGIPYMLFLFWGVVRNEGVFTLGCLRIFLGHNYLGLLALVGYYLGQQFLDADLARTSAWVGIAWLVTALLGTNQTSWLAGMTAQPLATD